MQPLRRYSLNTEMDNLILATHSFILNPQDNGGEAICLKTSFESNGDLDEVHMSQELTLGCYGAHCTSIQLNDEFNPQTLRLLADQLEEERLRAKSQLETKRASYEASRSWE